MKTRVRMIVDEAVAKLKALEDVVEQHFSYVGEGEYSHDFLMANEDACDVLVKYAPHRWELTETGIRIRIEQ